jgi:hypothetical protein
MQMQPDQLKTTTAPLLCNAVGRNADWPSSLVFYFNRVPTDDQMRYLHEVMARGVACMPEEPNTAWQPISTAPKDGTTVQLWDGHYQHTGFYDHSLPGWCALADYVEFVPLPTHWMPLPEPPAL